MANAFISLGVVPGGFGGLVRGLVSTQAAVAPLVVALVFQAQRLAATLVALPVVGDSGQQIR